MNKQQQAKRKEEELEALIEQRKKTDREETQKMKEISRTFKNLIREIEEW